MPSRSAAACVGVVSASALLLGGVARAQTSSLCCCWR
jgi:hypothetical protein